MPCPVCRNAPSLWARDRQPVPLPLGSETEAGAADHAPRVEPEQIRRALRKAQCLRLESGERGNRAVSGGDLLIPDHNGARMLGSEAAERSESRAAGEVVADPGIELGWRQSVLVVVDGDGVSGSRRAELGKTRDLPARRVPYRLPCKLSAYPPFPSLVVHEGGGSARPSVVANLVAVVRCWVATLAAYEEVIVAAGIDVGLEAVGPLDDYAAVDSHQEEALVLVSGTPGVVPRVSERYSPRSPQAPRHFLPTTTQGEPGLGDPPGLIQVHPQDRGDQPTCEM